MRAFIVPPFGEVGSVGERPKPEPEPGQLLVKVRAAGVNAMDPIIRGGFAKDYMEHRLPLTLGLDYAGTVRGGRARCRGICARGRGVRRRRQALLRRRQLRRVRDGQRRACRPPPPAGLAPEVAAALPLAGGTTIAAIDALGASPGDTIAVVGAGGGVGQLRHPARGASRAPRDRRDAGGARRSRPRARRVGRGRLHEGRPDRAAARPGSRRAGRDLSTSSMTPRACSRSHRR